MKNVFQPTLGGESRADAISRIVQAFTRETNVSVQTLAERVREDYEATVRQHSQTVDWHHEEDCFKRAAANGQILRRFVFGDVRMPCEIEESIVRSLDDPYRSALRRLLAGRHGQLDVPLPQATHGHDIASLGRLSTEFGEVLTALGPVVDAAGDKPEDAQHIEPARAALLGLIAGAEGLLAQLDAVITRTAAVPLRAVGGTQV